MMKADEEKDRTAVGRPVFKTGEGRTTSLVGSTPTLFRHTWVNRSIDFSFTGFDDSYPKINNVFLNSGR